MHRGVDHGIFYGIIIFYEKLASFTHSFTFCLGTDTGIHCVLIPVFITHQGTAGTTAAGTAGGGFQTTLVRGLSTPEKINRLQSRIQRDTVGGRIKDGTTSRGGGINTGSNGGAIHGVSGSCHDRFRFHNELGWILRAGITDTGKVWEHVVVVAGVAREKARERMFC